MVDMIERTLVHRNAIWWALHREKVRWIVGVLLVGVVGTYGVLMWQGVLGPFQSMLHALWGEAVAKWNRQAQGETFFHITMICLPFLQLSKTFVESPIECRAQLLLMPTGLAYRTRLPEWLQWLSPPWMMTWREVTAVNVRAISALGQFLRANIRLDGRGYDRTLDAFVWVEPHDDGAHLAHLSNRKPRQSDQERREYLQKTPLMQHLLAAAGRADIPAIPDFDHPQPTKWLHKTLEILGLCVMAALLIYALLDSKFIGEEYPTIMLLYPIGGGVVAAIASALWGARRKIPPYASVFSSIILMGYVSFVLYPGLLRLNQLTDTIGLQPYAYVLQADGTLTPRNLGLPTLRFPWAQTYWAQFPVGSVHELRLRQGGLGFYQVETRTLYKQTRKRE